MIMDECKIKFCKKIINIFEMGRETIDYSGVFIYADGPGSPPAKQVTLSFGLTEYGNLVPFVKEYANSSGKLAAQFKPYVSKIGKTSLVNDSKFISLLKQAGREDEVFRDLTDEYYDRKYIQPALKWFNGNGFKLPLSFLTILDSTIHSGSILSFLRNRFSEVPPAKGGNEKAWILAYLRVRRAWLASHSNKILRNTTYRADFILKCASRDDWGLFEPEYLVHGVKLKNV